MKVSKYLLSFKIFYILLAFGFTAWLYRYIYDDPRNAAIIPLLVFSVMFGNKIFSKKYWTEEGKKEFEKFNEELNEVMQKYPDKNNKEEMDKLKQEMDELTQKFIEEGKAVI